MPDAAIVVSVFHDCNRLMLALSKPAISADWPLSSLPPEIRPKHSPMKLKAERLKRTYDHVRKMGFTGSDRGTLGFPIGKWPRRIL
jgi:hypothetical protein